MGFTDTMRAERRTARSICRRLREQSRQIAAYLPGLERRCRGGWNRHPDANQGRDRKCHLDERPGHGTRGLTGICTIVFHDSPYRTVADVEHATAG